MKFKEGDFVYYEGPNECFYGQIITVVKSKGVLGYFSKNPLDLRDKNNRSRMQLRGYRFSEIKHFKPELIGLQKKPWWKRLIERIRK